MALLFPDSVYPIATLNDASNQASCQVRYLLNPSVGEDAILAYYEEDSGDEDTDSSLLDDYVLHALKAYEDDFYEETDPILLAKYILLGRDGTNTLPLDSEEGTDED